MKRLKLLVIILSIIILLLLTNFCYREVRTEKHDSLGSDTGFLYDMHESEITRVLGFSRPVSIIKGNDRFYVADYADNNVFIFDENFTFVSKFGGLGDQPGKFNRPHAVDIDAKGNLYVTDYKNKRIQKFSKDGKFISVLETPRQFGGPSSAYFDNDHNLYVSDYGSNSLMKFSSDDVFLGWIGAKEDGTLTDGWEMTGNSIKSTKPGGFDRLQAAKVDNAGNIYVADTGNNRIQRFSKEGKFLGWIGAKENGTITDGWELTGSAVASQLLGGFDDPVALDFTEKGNLVILGYGTNRVQMFSTEGKFLAWFGGTEDGGVTKIWRKEKEGLPREGAELGAVSYPYDIRIYKDKMYIADTNNLRIEIVRFYD